LTDGLKKLKAPKDLGRSYKFDTIINAFRLLASQKSRDTMFQDTLNQIYVESKRQDMSQSMFTVFT
jgi:hypothetical protein